MDEVDWTQMWEVAVLSAEVANREKKVGGGGRQAKIEPSEVVIDVHPLETICAWHAEELEEAPWKCVCPFLR